MKSTQIDWWKSAVVYQVYPRSFADSDGDGVGDLGGILDHLDYLELLGVDVVWLSPVYRSPMADNGYDISDYTDVDPLFGTLGQLDELIAQLHARDMKLVMDLVVNHTSSAHAWFAESRSSRDNPKRDWYWWRSLRPGHEPGTPGAEPTNWGSAFGGPAWTYDERTGEYYLHVFAPAQPDLNWENPRGAAGGLRHDALLAGPRRRRLPDGRHQRDLEAGRPGRRRRPGYAAGRRGRRRARPALAGCRRHRQLRRHAGVGAQRTSRSTSSSRRCTARSSPVVRPGCSTSVRRPAARWRRRCSTPTRRAASWTWCSSSSTSTSAPARRGSGTSGRSRMLQLKQSLGRWQDGLAEVGWNSLYLGNHDQPRCVSRFGSDAPEHREQSAKALATVLHLHRGTPYVYQGDELGMSNPGFTRLDSCATSSRSTTTPPRSPGARSRPT